MLDSACRTETTVKTKVTCYVVQAEPKQKRHYMSNRNKKRHMLPSAGRTQARKKGRMLP